MHKHRERMIKRGPSVLLRMRTYRAVTGPAESGDNHHRKAFLTENGFSKGENVSFNQRSHKPVHSKDMIAQEKGILLVDEFLFPHGIYTLQDGVFSNESLKYGYDTVAKFIKLTELQAR